MGSGCGVVRVLQLLPYPQIAPSHARDGGRNHGSCVERSRSAGGRVTQGHTNGGLPPLHPATKSRIITQFHVSVPYAAYGITAPAANESVTGALASCALALSTRSANVLSTHRRARVWQWGKCGKPTPKYGDFTPAAPAHLCERKETYGEQRVSYRCSK